MSGSVTETAWNIGKDSRIQITVRMSVDDWKDVYQSGLLTADMRETIAAAIRAAEKSR
jgi:hypothetical protein